MHNTLLYKYRGLGNFKNFVDILLKNRLFAAPYKLLNDPMEGQYYYDKGELDIHTLQKIRNDKMNLRLCSLSRKKDNELMWSHYADGQHGVAIGVKIDPLVYQIRPINYTGLSSLRREDIVNDSAIEILSHKLCVWSYEEEERVFTTDSDFINVAVKEVITGRSMSNLDFGLIRELVNKINPTIAVIKASTFMDNVEL